MRLVRTGQKTERLAATECMGSTMSHRVIFHIDMDAFYAAIEQRDNPALRGVPVVVGSAPDKRGVVCTASYEARRYGIHSAMPSRTAYSRCPKAVFLRPRMEHYADVSKQLMAVCGRFTPAVEKLSIDEAFLDMTHFQAAAQDPEGTARRLKQTISDQLQLTASVGIAPNKFLAKLASDLEKPDGLTITPASPEGIREFLAPLEVKRIWGVGKVTAGRLKEANLSTIGDIHRMGQVYLAALCGANFAAHLWNLAQGVDDRPVVTEHEEKSISNEETFGIDCSDPDEVRRVLICLAEKVGRRLRKAQKLARTAQIKIRFSDFTTYTRQRRFADDTDSDRDLLSAATDLFDGLAVADPVRLIGFGVHNLSGCGERLRQPSLFDTTQTAPARKGGISLLDEALDELREKYGSGIVTRGMPKQRP